MYLEKVTEGEDQPLGLRREELPRYSRQMLLPEVGLAGQEKLRRARVLVVGAGGLGSPVLLYLAAAGVGTLGIVEFDSVDESNLHRQILYGQSEVGLAKARMAAAKLADVNPYLELEVTEARLSPENAPDLIARYDVVVDATDNFAARYLINDCCVAAGRPNVSASILRFEGQVSVFRPGQGPCYRCLYPAAPPPELAPSCAEAGVLGVLPGVIGCIQATEVLKLVIGMGDPLEGRLLTYDALAMRFRELRIKRDPHCAACAPGADPLALARTPAAAAAAPAVEEIGPTALRSLLREGRVRLLDVRTDAEAAIARIDPTPPIPVSELEERLEEVPRDLPLVCYCHKGARSRRAAALLQDRGFGPVLSLAGGIDAWSREVDPDVALY